MISLQIPLNPPAHLLVEDGLSLTTITGLLAIVTALSLREERGLARLVLRYLVRAIQTTTFQHLLTHTQNITPRTYASCKLCPCSLHNRIYRLLSEF